MKYLLDTNILVSGFLWEGKERMLLNLIKKGKINIVISQYVLDELARVLSRLGHEDKVNDVLTLISRVAEIIDVTIAESSACINDVSDEKDAPVLAACIKSGAVLVTGDMQFAKDSSRFVTVLRTSELLRSLDY